MLTLFLFGTAVLALPLQNTTATDDKVGWTATPRVRGTFDLLLSCLTTLSLCAWTAYHPNVYSVARSKWSRLAHRLVWMMVAIFVPEVVLWCACEQWWAARRLRNKINSTIEGKGVDEEQGAEEAEKCFVCKAYRREELEELDRRERVSEEYGLAMLFEDMDSSSMSRESNSEEQPRNTSTPSPTPSLPLKPKPRPQPWTMEQSFFALSGGYALPSPLPAHPPLTLTPTGILLLHRLNVLPSTPISTIADKSKADAIAKALVCIQAGWFLIQCIARAAKRLPVTVLEIHVLAHVLCAFAIYAVWFEKGYDIGAPIVLEGERAEELGALFAADDGMGCSRDDLLIDVLKCSYTSPSLTLSEIAPSCQRPTQISSTRKYWHRALNYFELDRPPKQPPRTKTAKSTLPKVDPADLSAHLESANRALLFLKEQDVHFLYLSKGSAPTADESDTAERQGTGIHIPARYVVHARSDLHIEGLDRDTKNTRSDVFQGRQINAYALLSTLYAALHALAWSSSHFPTPLEAWLWRGSTLAMLAAPVALMTSTWIAHLSSRLADKFSTTVSISNLTPISASTSHSKRPPPPPHRGPCMLWLRICHAVMQWILDSLWFLSMIIALLGMCVYPFARLFVLGESFAGLRSVDGRVYQMVQWTGFLPHVG